jgi:hypothetical protein
VHSQDDIGASADPTALGGGHLATQPQSSRASQIYAMRKPQDGSPVSNEVSTRGRSGASLVASPKHFLHASIVAIVNSQRDATHNRHRGQL